MTMVVERLAQALRFDRGRFFVLYGMGIRDQFITRDYVVSAELL
jgi:hypothetical protein